MSHEEGSPLSDDELAAEAATALPDKEVVSLLDLNADLDLAIDAAAPIDLAVAANANVAAPIDAAVGANILSTDSTAQSLADQDVAINQGIQADATANALQDSVIDQSDDTVGDGTGVTTGTTGDGTTGDAGDGTSTTGGTADGATGALGGAAGAVDGATDGLTDGVDAGTALGGDLLDVDVNLAADADIAAPIDGAVAANANVAAPIDAAVSANVGSVGSEATAIADQDAVINQHVEGSAEATADQTSDLEQ